MSCPPRENEQQHGLAVLTLIHRFTPPGMIGWLEVGNGTASRRFRGTALAAPFGPSRRRAGYSCPFASRVRSAGAARNEWSTSCGRLWLEATGSSPQPREGRRQRLRPRPGARQPQRRAPARAHDLPATCSRRWRTRLGSARASSSPVRQTGRSSAAGPARAARPPAKPGCARRRRRACFAFLFLCRCGSSPRREHGGGGAAPRPRCRRLLVGDEGGVAVSLCVEDLELRAGMQAGSEPVLERGRSALRQLQARREPEGICTLALAKSRHLADTPGRYWPSMSQRDMDILAWATTSHQPTHSDLLPEGKRR